MPEQTAWLRQHANRHRRQTAPYSHITARCNVERRQKLAKWAAVATCVPWEVFWLPSMSEDAERTIEGAAPCRPEAPRSKLARGPCCALQSGNAGLTGAR